MFRPTLESLEKREVFSINPAVACEPQFAGDAAGHAAMYASAPTAKAQDIEVENDETHRTRGVIGRTESVSKDESITIGGNRYSVDSLSRQLLPYIEQGNLYRQTGNTQGIIAILIGLLRSPTAAPNARATSLSSADSPTLLASNEYFSQFASAGIIATTLGRGSTATKPTLSGGPDRVTHDVDFESWANALSFDRGYLPPALTAASRIAIASGKWEGPDFDARTK